MSNDNNKNFSNFNPENHRAEADARHLAADWKPWPDNTCDENLNASTSTPISETSNNMNMDVDDDSNQGGMTNEEFLAAIRRVSQDGLFIPIFIVRGGHENVENMEPGDTQPRPIKTPRSRKLAAQAHQNREGNDQERKM